MEQTKQAQIKCVRPECKSTGEFQYIGEASDLGKKHLTIVDADGNITYYKTTHYYKCMACGATFESDVAPIHKRIIHG